MYLQISERQSNEGAFHSQWSQQTGEYVVHWHFTGIGVGSVHRLFPIETRPHLFRLIGQQSFRHCHLLLAIPRQESDRKRFSRDLKKFFNM